MSLKVSSASVFVFSPLVTSLLQVIIPDILEIYHFLWYFKSMEISVRSDRSHLSGRYDVICNFIHHNISNAPTFLYLFLFRTRAKMDLAQEEAERAENMLLHEDEIAARPARTWYVTPPSFYLFRMWNRLSWQCTHNCRFLLSKKKQVRQYEANCHDWLIIVYLHHMMNITRSPSWSAPHPSCDIQNLVILECITLSC